jgi:hypothetical protein
MNPLRRVDCSKYDESCNEYTCKYLHVDGRDRGEAVIRRFEQVYGTVRCPYEWEISAVRS